MPIFPPIKSALYEQLRQVPAGGDGDLEYRPCAVTLDDGRELPCVYAVDQKPYTAGGSVRERADSGSSTVDGGGGSSRGSRWLSCRMEARHVPR